MGASLGFRALFKLIYSSLHYILHYTVLCFLSSLNALCFSKATYSVFLSRLTSWTVCSQQVNWLEINHRVYPVMYIFECLKYPWERLQRYIRPSLWLWVPRKSCERKREIHWRVKINPEKEMIPFLRVISKALQRFLTWWQGFKGWVEKT